MAGIAGQIDEDYNYDDWTYLLLDSLPTEAECVQAVQHHAAKYGTTTQKNHIHQFSLRLLQLWQKAFGSDVRYVTIPGIKHKLDRSLKIYDKDVYKAKGSRRVNMIKWKREHHVLLNILSKDVNPDEFDVHERRFFVDQKSLSRKWLIDTFHVDMEHERFLAEQELHNRLDLDDDQFEVEDISDQLPEHDTSNNLNYSLNRSGTIRSTVPCTEIATQTHVTYNLRTGARNFQESINAERQRVVCWYDTGENWD